MLTDDEIRAIYARAYDDAEKGMHLAGLRAVESALAAAPQGAPVAVALKGALDTLAEYGCSDTRLYKPGNEPDQEWSVPLYTAPPAPAPQPSAEPSELVRAVSVEWLLAQCEEYQRRAHEAEREVLRLRALDEGETKGETRVYIDGEWNSYRGELLSLALVAADGAEWYEVLEFDGTPDPWVAQNVLPKLRQAPVSLEALQTSLQRFLARYPAGVHIVADWPEASERVCRALVSGPGQRIDTPPLTMEIVRIDPASLDPHNALADARALRAAMGDAPEAKGGGR